MSLSRVARFGFPASLIVIWVALQGTGVQAQQPGGTVQTDKVQPVNSGANPYRVVRDWARLRAEGRQGPDDAGEAGREGNPARSHDRPDGCGDRPGQW